MHIFTIFATFLVFLCVVYSAKLRKYPNGRYYGAKSHEGSVEEHQDLSKVPGEPGVDYPVYHLVPETSFSCANVPFAPGMYANVETGCQAYHVCHDGREGHQGAAFLCANGTLFNQKEFACDWWYKVDCREAQDHYRLNADPESNPFVPKKKSEEAKSAEQYNYKNKYFKSPYPANSNYYEGRYHSSQSAPAKYYNEPSYQQNYHPDRFY